ncbi:hypothetical protein [Rhizobium sp. PL01]|uniref:hypothetical protein n=1 Tax=Rhizobium sp. PL01 TaxID=3085631 RepID=UPI002981E831|nr:hypothetical protein [Rhizobium sp. PL01]MDW5316135.1 hypothetical protein [Rhizobium sp. PL01]
MKSRFTDPVGSWFTGAWASVVFLLFKMPVVAVHERDNGPHSPASFTATSFS